MITVFEKSKCSGCHACYSVCPQNCIQMVPDEEGFAYPLVNLKKCIDCNLCARVCPINQSHKADNHPQVLACYNIDELVRLDSSSGGLFTLFAEQIVNNNGVVFGATFDDDFNVLHRYAHTIDELRQFRGSKYVQSIIGDSYKQVRVFLNQGKPVLFSGTPCQIAGLRAYLNHDYESLYCVDIICHGVPSPLVWRKYISYRESIAGSKIRNASFRRKNNGWRHFSMSFSFHNDTEYTQQHTQDPYMRAFLRNVCLRPSCYRCNFKTLQRESDITLADFWGVHRLLPELYDDKGTSLIFLNTSKGKTLFDEIQSRIVFKEVDLNRVLDYNPCAIKSVQINPQREYFFADINRLSFDELIDKYCRDTVYRTLRRKTRAAVQMLVSLVKR